MARSRTLSVAPLLLVSMLAWRPAAADEANRNFMPFGERAAFLGNAGITSDLGEAVFYNPANLARVGHPNLSVSGNIYARFELQADPLYIIDGEDQPFKASGFISNPSTLVSTYSIGGFSLATAVLIPEAFKFKNRVSFDSATLHSTLLQESAQESLWLGIGGGHRITDTIRGGVSLFIARESAAQLLFVHSEIVDPASVSEFTSSTDISVLNLTAILGLSWQAHPKLVIGARANIPPIRLTGSADIYQASITATDAMDAKDEQAFEDVDVSKPYPWDVGAGFSFKPNDRLELVLDVNLQLPDELVQMDDERVGREELEVGLAPRAGGGVEWRFLSQTWLRLGFLYNGSAFDDPKELGDETSEDFYGVTGGVAWQKDRTHTALGAFFMQSDSKLLVEGSDPLALSDARTRFYGALLTISYRL
jgi:hypothetical protein